MRTCSKCKKSYPATTEFFHKNNQKKSGLSCWCKACSKVCSRKSHLKTFYDLTVKQHEQMYLDQNGCCAICGRPVEYDKIHTDHNHSTNKVRKLLCVNCNLWVAVLDDVEWHKKAEKYLLENN